MKFLIDESVEYSVVLFLRSKGFDTNSIAENYPSLEDKIILRFAYQENRILITNDKDFGELINKFKFPHKGVILFRMGDDNYNSKIESLKILIKKFPEKLTSYFVVVTPAKVRFKKTAISSKIQGRGQN